jgi:predicted nucleic acid-binding protein
VGYHSNFNKLVILPWKPAREIEMPMDLLTANLDRGEKESIALALSKNALLLMDEERGRD